MMTHAAVYSNKSDSMSSQPIVMCISKYNRFLHMSFLYVYIFTVHMHGRKKTFFVHFFIDQMADYLICFFLNYKVKMTNILEGRQQDQI